MSDSNPLKQHFATFAAYNRWANERLYEVVASLSDGQYREDRGAFFGSLHGTLNHILVGDRAWLSRLTGEGESPPRLDIILYQGFDDLRAAREAEDERIIRYTAGLDDARLSADLHYRNIAGEANSQPLPLVLAHFFNHQTHHRGQAHDLLTQFGCDAPPLDLIYFIRE